MRLIDADKYPCKDCGSMDDWCKHTCGMLKEWLNTTAYDVEKVIEELTDNAIEENNIDYDMEISLEDAIDIVKRGGVE